MLGRAAIASRATLLVFAFAAVAASSAHAQSSNLIGTRIHARVFYEIGSITPMLEYAGSGELAAPAYVANGLLAGAYFRVHPNVKLGAFYGFEDWGSAAGSDTSASHLVLDATPRLQLHFLPGGWVAALKARYDYSFAAGSHTLLVRPGLTYFHIADYQIRFNVALSYKSAFILNEPGAPLYLRGPEANFRYHLTREIQADVGIGFETALPSTQVEYLARRDGSGNASLWYVDAGFVINLEHRLAARSR